MALGALQPSEATILGIAKETTPGTPVAPTNYITATAVQPVVVIPQLADNSMRSTAAKTQQLIDGPSQTTYQVDGPLYSDQIGWFIAGLLADLTVTGASDPYTTNFSLLNTNPFQPKSYTLTDWNGVQGRTFAGSMVNELDVAYSADALATYSAKLNGINFATASKPTQSFTANLALPSWKASVSVNSLSGPLVTDFSLNIKRSVMGIPGLTGTQPITAVFAAGDLQASGTFTMVYDATNGETVYGYYLAGTQVPVVIDLNTTEQTFAHEVKFTMTLCDLSAVQINRSLGKYVELAVTFEGVANSTDVGTSAGTAPIKAITKSSLATGTYA